MILFMNPYTFSQDTEIDEEALKLLQVEFDVNLIQPGQENVWSEKKVKYTIPGYSILLKVEGTNIKFHGFFTPYLKDNNLFLIAKSQVWLIDPAKTSIRFFTCIKSISMKFGEKVVYLPFGITKSNDENEVHNIEIEILIIPYKQETKETEETKEVLLNEETSPEK